MILPQHILDKINRVRERRIEKQQISNQQPGVQEEWILEILRDELRLANIPCELCFGFHDWMEIHHRDGNDRNNSLTNLMYLCRPCHTRVSRQNLNISGVDVPIILYVDTMSEVSHFIPGHITCGNLHGHSIRIETWITGKVLEDGFVIDFKKAKEILRQFDHKCINSEVSFRPTAENMVKYFAKQLIGIGNIMKVKIRFWETTTSYAEIELDAEFRN